MKRKPKGHTEAEVLLRPAARESAFANEAGGQKGSEGAAGKVAKSLRNMGFEVTAQSGASVSISGPDTLFEKVFGADAGGGGEQSDALSVPPELDEHVEGIYVQRPPTYHDT